MAPHAGFGDTLLVSKWHSTVAVTVPLKLEPFTMWEFQGSNRLAVLGRLLRCSQFIQYLSERGDQLVGVRG